MTSKNVLMVVGGLVALMGLWGLGVYFGWVPAVFDVVDPWWHAVLKVVLGGYAFYVAYSEK